MVILKFKIILFLHFIIILFRKYINGSKYKIIRTYICGKKWISLEICWLLKSLFEYYKTNFRLSRTHIKSIFFETFPFSRKPSLKTSLMKILILTRLGFPRLTVHHHQDIQLQCKTFLQCLSVKLSYLRLMSTIHNLFQPFILACNHTLTYLFPIKVNSKIKVGPSSHLHFL